MILYNVDILEDYIEIKAIMRLNGGEGGIRTHGNLAATHALQACLLDHSSTSPQIKREGISGSLMVAERAGFEPALRFRRPLFESGTINHSDTSP